MTELGLFVGLLGPLVVRRDGRDVHIGSGKQRLALGALAVAGRVLSTDELVDVLWPDEAPNTAIGTLQTHLSRLRGLIGVDAVADAGGGYRLQIADDQLDSAAFTAKVKAAREARARGEAETARRELRAALAMWRGPALATFRYEPFAQLDIARLEALRIEVIEDCYELDLETGDMPTAGELEALVAEHPFRERLTLLLMRALYTAGRQADALAAANRLRAALRDDLGLDPTPQIAALELQILQHDSTLSNVTHDVLPRRHWRAVVEQAEIPAPDPTVHCERLIDQVVALRRAGRTTDARSTAAAAVRLASTVDDHRLLGAAALSLAGPPEDAVLHEPLDADLLERALTLLPSEDPLTAMLRARLAVSSIDTGDVDRGHALLAAAEAAALDATAELYVLRARHRTWFDPAALDDRLALTRRIVELARLTAQADDQAWASRWLAIDLLETGDLEGFDGCIGSLAEAADQLHDVHHHWGVVARRAGQRTATGPLDEADALTMEALNLAAGIGNEYTLAATSALFFVLRWRQHRLEEVEALVRDVAGREAAAAPLLPLLYLELGRTEEARTALADLTRRGVKDVLASDSAAISRLMALTALSYGAFGTDNRDVARQLLDEFERVQSTMAVVHPGLTVMAPMAELRAAALACVGDLDAAITHAEEASRVCAASGCAAVQVRTDALLAVLLRRRGARGDVTHASRLDERVRSGTNVTGAAPPGWYEPGGG